MKEFLIEQKAEVIAMSIYEYNEEYVKKVLHEEGFEEGFDAGKSTGLSERIITGISTKLVENIESLMKNLSLDLPGACAALDTTVEEYTKAKEKI